MKYPKQTTPWYLRWLITPAVKLTHHEKAPTDPKLDARIEEYKFLMKRGNPLLRNIVNEKIRRFFKYYKGYTARLIIFFGAISIAGYLLVTRYIQPILEPKTIVVEKQVDEYSNFVVKNLKEIFIDPSRAELTKDNLDYFASEFKIEYWYVVRQQIMLETGTFTSESCTKGHNLFGMRLPGQRETTATGEYLGHAQYKHWVYSLYDYKVWQEHRLKSNPLKQKENYYNWLVRMNYATDSTYIPKLKTMSW